MVPGFVLEGPQKVLLNKRDTLPLASFVSTVNKDLLAYQFPTSAILFASRKDDRNVYAAMALERPSDFVEPSGEPQVYGFTG